MNGKENDLRIDLKWILIVVLPEVNLAFVIPPNQLWYTDEDWIKKYPNAFSIHKVYGQSPSIYATKERVK